MSIEQKEGLPVVRIMMLLSSLSPLFIMFAVRGADNVVSDNVLWTIIAFLVFIPYFMIELRIYIAMKNKDVYTLSTSNHTQNKEYLFTYLFTILLPLYSISFNKLREFIAIVIAMLFVMLVLWNMNLHYINLFFALKGYKVFTIVDNNHSKILLTTRQYLPVTPMLIHKLSNSVFIEVKNYDYSK